MAGESDVSDQKSQSSNERKQNVRSTRICRHLCWLSFGARWRSREEGLYRYGGADQAVSVRGLQRLTLLEWLARYGPAKGIFPTLITISFAECSVTYWFEQMYRRSLTYESCRPVLLCVAALEKVRSHLG